MLDELGVKEQKSHEVGAVMGGFVQRLGNTSLNRD